MSGANQVISTPDFPGPVFGTGGNITVDVGASIAGGPTGVYAQNFGIGTLSNQGAINGGPGSLGSPGASAGAGVANANTITTLVNSGVINGGAGPSGTTPRGPDAGGAGVSNSGTIKTLTNTGKILGGNDAGIGALGQGISNSGIITNLTNNGTIAGGNGGTGRTFSGGVYSGGAGIANSGTIASLTNSGIIHGGKATDDPGDAIYSAGYSGDVYSPSIGAITNTGQIIGYVVIDIQASLTINGGTGKTFGTWIGGAINGGAITIGNGNLIFASGNTEIDEDISVDGGSGTVTNDGVLRFAALEVIKGNFTNDGTAQVSAGKLEIDGAVTGAGTDTISGPAKLQFDAGVSTAATLGEQDIDLSGKGGTMALVDPTGFYGKISDFGSNDTVKLEGFWAFSALSHASGVTTLTLAEGATRHAFDFVGDYTRREFHISSGSITKVTYV